MARPPSVDGPPAAIDEGPWADSTTTASSASCSASTRWCSPTGCPPWLVGRWRAIPGHDRGSNDLSGASVVTSYLVVTLFVVMVVMAGGSGTPDPEGSAGPLVHRRRRSRPARRPARGRAAPRPRCRRRVDRRLDLGVNVEPRFQLGPRPRCPARVRPPRPRRCRRRRPSLVVGDGDGLDDLHVVVGHLVHLDVAHPTRRRRRGVVGTMSRSTVLGAVGSATAGRASPWMIGGRIGSLGLWIVARR